MFGDGSHNPKNNDSDPVRTLKVDVDTSAERARIAIAFVLYELVTQ